MKKFELTLINKFEMENIRIITAEDKSEAYHKAYKLKLRDEKIQNLKEVL